MAVKMDCLCVHLSHTVYAHAGGPKNWVSLAKGAWLTP